MVKGQNKVEYRNNSSPIVRTIKLSKSQSKNPLYGVSSVYYK